MELDNLKEAWVALDNRLKRNEKLNESVILEMMRSKAGKIVSRSIGFEMLSVAVSLVLTPLIINSFFRHGGKLWVYDAFLVFMAASCFAYTFWGIFKLSGLMKFDVAKNVGNNIHCINRYDIQMKREKKFISCFLGPVLVICAAGLYVAVKATLSLWVFMISAIGAAGLISYWSYKIHDKGINSVLQSLEEIRELKEE